ncbi:VapC toxin family PIN domain ribonuclease [Cyanobium sp. HWJ4-Hawea]|nr:VapC toxin family PIN domain ribonuclease [Cyanobium sp. HWJ4-Hawea]
MTDSADLPDLNVWLALAAAQHPHHAQALHYWEKHASSQVLFCTVTALGLTRLLSQPKLMGEAVMNSAEASALLLAFCKQPGVRMATLTIANGWRLVSFDRDFKRFENLNWLQLSH